jgi:hypothetical protein
MTHENDHANAYIDYIIFRNVAIFKEFFFLLLLFWGAMENFQNILEYSFFWVQLEIFKIKNNYTTTEMLNLPWDYCTVEPGGGTPSQKSSIHP